MLKDELIDYANSLPSVKKIGNLKTYTPRKHDENFEHDNCAYFSNESTMQPPHKGLWRKYIQLRKNKRFAVNKRNCINNVKLGDNIVEIGSCTAQVFYVSKWDTPGTLIVPVGKHSEKCKQHVSIQSTDKGNHSEKCKPHNVSTLSTDKGRDAILDYIRHDPQDIITCSDAVDLNSANGNQVFEMKSTKFITNEKPKGRPWGKLNNYNTTKKLSCNVKQRL